MQVRIAYYAKSWYNVIVKGLLITFNLGEDNMIGKMWLEAIERFFYDGHKMEDERYSLKIGGEYFDYVVPAVDGDDWVYFYIQMMDEDKEMTPNEVFKRSTEHNLLIPVEILEYLEW